MTQNKQLTNDWNLIQKEDTFQRKIEIVSDESIRSNDTESIERRMKHLEQATERVRESMKSLQSEVSERRNEQEKDNE
jgi:hypothetical protein